MAAFDFPNSPSVNDTYSANGSTYTWNGTKWVRTSPSIGAQGATGAGGSTGPSGATGAQGATGATGAQGAQGHQGATGSGGATGAQGATGSGGSTGSTGAQGAEGNFGGATFYYTFESNTTNANPGAGDLRLDNSTQNAATGIYICDTDEDGTDIASYLQTIDDSTSTIKGHVKITNKLDSSQFLLFTISSLTDNTGYFDITVSPVDSSATSPFSANEDILITFARTGDKGDTGAQGAAGAQGATGSTGAQGATGSGGSTGPTGAQGATGSGGSTGPSGATGAQGANGGTDIVNDSSPQLGGNLDTNSKNIVFGDSSGTTVNRLTFGGQADMKLFHDGTNSVVSNATGDLYVNNNADIIIKPANDCFIKPQDGENGITVIGNGAVELYNDNSRRLRTYSDGVKIASDSSTGRLVLEDTDGNFAWQLTGFDSASSTGGRGVFQDANGGVVLDMRASGGNIFCYNNLKLNGNATADNLKLVLGAGSDFSIFHDGSNSFVQHTGTGGLYLDALNNSADIVLRSQDNINMYTNSASQSAIDCVGNGGVLLYHQGNKKFETVSSGVEITNASGIAALTIKGTGSNRADVRVLATGSGNANVYLDASNGDLNGADYAVLQHKNDLNLALVNYAEDIEMYVRGGTLGSGALDKCFHAHASGNVELYSNGTKRLETTSSGIDLFGNTDGVLNINTTDGRGSFIRLRYNNATKVWVGSSEGFGTGDQDDGALMAVDNIHLMSGQTRRITITGGGMAELYGGGSSNPWGASFRAADSNNSTRCFFEGVNGQSNRTFSIMSENGKLRVSGNGTAGTSTGSQLVYLSSTSATSWSGGSDIRLKENITELSNVLDKVKNYRCARFNFIGDDASDIENIKFGFIAQDWVDDFPEVLSTSTKDADDPTDTTEYYGMQYTETIPVLLKAIQELNAKVETLQNEVNTLKSS